MDSTTPDQNPARGRERIKRPKPERTEPIRGGWLSLFGPPPSGASPPPRAPSRVETPAALSDDAVSRGVDLSYRVLDDYIQQGQQAARLMRDRSYGPEALRSDVQDLTARGFQYASDITEVLLAVFFELLPSAARRQTGPPPFFPPVASAGWSGRETPPAPEGPVTPAPSAEQMTGHARVALQVESVRPATVTVDLQPRAAGASLVCHDLRTADPSKPRLAAATIDGGSGEEPVAVRIRIPPEQPPGTYRGEVIDTATSLPAGSVTVHLGP